MTAEGSDREPIALAQLAHADTAPVAFADLRVETTEDHGEPWQPNWPIGTERRVIARDPMTGGSTSLLRFPANYDRVEETRLLESGEAPRFEYHTCHEEIVCLEGEYVFGVPPLFDFSAKSYLNHPPYWLHPAHQRSGSGVLLLVKNSGPVDFGFCTIPHAWDGREHYLSANEVEPSPSEAVTNLGFDDARLRPVHEHGRSRQNVTGERLWTDQVTGWSTWRLRAPAGTVLTAANHAAPPPDAFVGDEWFVLDGEVSFDDDTLGPYGYRCDSTTYPAGGGATAATDVHVLRWTRGDQLA